MYKSQRESEIIELLNTNGYVTVEYLARKLNISASSIRRDLSLLESRGIVTRSYGGVQPADKSARLIPFTFRSHENNHEKRKIASVAATLVKSGDMIFVDGSSTCHFLLKELVGISGITIVTNSIEGVAYLTQFQCHVISTGGHVSEENRAVFVGDMASRAFMSMHAHIAFFSAAAVDDKGIIRDCYESEVPVRKMMLENADKRVFLCDGSKRNAFSGYTQCSIADTDIVISDYDFEGAFQDRFSGTVFMKA